MKILGEVGSKKNHFNITLAKEYVVFGLTCSFDNRNMGCFVQILSDFNHLIHVPIHLFDIIDDRISNFWVFRKFLDGNVTLWPRSFYQEYYHDDLFEEIPEVVEDFKKIKEQIMHEFD